MPKQIRLNAFDMNCVGHQSPGLWTHPRDRADTYNTLEYWTDLARTLERGKFDAMFLADVLGIYDVYKGSPATALENAVQVPVNDPLMVIPAMAVVTEHLGFGVTCALSYELPYPFARRMSTLDHLTKRPHRLEHRHRLPGKRRPRHGHAAQLAHDERYAIAEDYMQAVYKLWEASWEDGAVLRDRARAAVSPTRTRSTASRMRVRISRSTRSICASRRRNARRCCFRPAHRTAAANSPPATPNACSSTGRRRR